MPGVADRLAEARALGLKLGVASSSSRAWVEGHLTRLGILQAFGSIKTADDVASVKPDPEIYRSAAALGSRPDQTLAIEDSAHGVNAARSAGLHCLAVPNSITRHLPLQNADRRFESLEEVSLASLRADFGRRGNPASRPRGSGS
jgi:beta-phosphoglucomutase-like phosphatase (HAD superfamily)